MKGGRVELFQPLGAASVEESLHFIDVNSLYPYVAMQNAFPVGKYQIVTEGDLDDITFEEKSGEYFWFGSPLVGLVHCTVLCPQVS